MCCFLTFPLQSEVLFFVLKLLEHLDWRDFDQLESAVTDGCRNMDMSVATTRTPKGPFPALLEGRHTMLDVMFVLGKNTPLSLAIAPGCLRLARAPLVPCSTHWHFAVA